jgi:cell division protein ZapE
MAGTETQVADRLAAEIEAGRLAPDASQQEAARYLDRLNVRLRSRVPSFTQRLRSRLRFTPPAVQTLRGVYLWGGVGRGKTLLMDFFEASLGDVPRERTHFYRFMRQVHADLRGIGNRTDPLDTVAQRFAARERVICLDEFFVADIADAMILAGLFAGLFR